MHKHLAITSYLCLASSIPLFAAEYDGGSAGVKQQGATSKETADKNTPVKKVAGGAPASKKSPGAGKASKKKTERGSSAKRAPERDAGFDMQPPIVCKSIDGFEVYEPLPGAAQTSEEKLLVYVRPFGFQTEKVDAGYQSHLSADGQLRKRGEKAILRQKKKLLEYKPVAAFPPQTIYLKCSISLKGLAPGDYELTIVLHDEIAKAPPASQIVKFKVIPPMNPTKERERKPPHVLDSLYSPFLEFRNPNDD